MSGRPTYEDFEPYRGSLFHFEGWHGTLRLADIRVRHGQTVPGTTLVPYTIIFDGPAGDILPAGVYQVRPENGPSMEFHILPIHTLARDRQEYQLVFN